MYIKGFRWLREISGKGPKTPALHIEMDNISVESLQKQAIKKDDTIYLICASGGRSAKVADTLRKQGFLKVVNVEGGTNAWIDAKLPIAK